MAVASSSTAPGAGGDAGVEALLDFCGALLSFAATLNGNAADSKAVSKQLIRRFIKAPLPIPGASIGARLRTRRPAKWLHLWQQGMEDLETLNCYERPYRW
jgi:hypothetical protein